MAPTKKRTAPDFAQLQAELKATINCLSAIQKTADSFKARVKVLRGQVAKAKARG